MWPEFWERKEKCIKLDFSFSKYAGVMNNFSLIWEAAVDIDNENGSWLLLKWIQIITGSIKMNKSRTRSEIFCSAFESGSS